MGQDQSGLGSNGGAKSRDEDICRLFDNTYRVRLDEMRRQTTDLTMGDNDNHIHLPNFRGRIIRLQKVICNSSSSQDNQNENQPCGSAPHDILYGVKEAYADGSSYEGQKLNSVRHGHGVFLFVNKALYKGSWRNNHMHGNGLLYYSNGQLAFQGRFRDSQFDGHGTLLNENVDYNQSECDSEYYKDISTIERRWVRYEGEFENDKKHGKGRLFFPNGHQILADFYKDNVHGEGILFNQDGKVLLKGKWDSNKLIGGRYITSNKD